MYVENEYKRKKNQVTHECTAILKQLYVATKFLINNIWYNDK